MDTVPAELGAVILENASDMTSLWTVIRASPHMYRIFSKYRESILPVVISRDIGPILIGDALATLHSSRFTSNGKVGSGNTERFIRGRTQPEAMEWMEKYYLPMSGALRWVEPYLFGSEKLEWSEKLKLEEINRRNTTPPAKDMLPLWEIHKYVKFMADLYVQSTLHIFNRSIEADSEGVVTKPIIHTLNEISCIEKQRIFRAIYRFIIFGNLFAPSTLAIWEEDELSEYFVCRFPAWEVEEINCIYDFMTDKITQKWQEMEDNEYDRLAANPELWGIAPESDPATCRWSTNFFSQSSRRSFKAMQAFFVTLPIMDLKAIFQAKGEFLVQLVRKRAVECGGLRDPFLGEALGVWPEHFPVIPGGEKLRCDAECGSKGEKGFFDRDSEDDDPMLSNKTWYWANRWHPREMYLEPTTSDIYGNEKDLEGLRRVGYVFWESSRWGNTLQFDYLQGFGESLLVMFPRPTFDDQSLSVEERIRKLAGCGCGESMVPEHRKCTLEGHIAECAHLCRLDSAGKEV